MRSLAGRGEARVVGLWPRLVQAFMALHVLWCGVMCLIVV